MMRKAALERTWAIARKEFLHIVNDPRTLFIVILLPVLQLVMFGYAMNLEIQRVDLAVVDYAHSSLSRELLEHFVGSRFFKPFPYDGPLSGVEDLFRARRAQAVLIIPQDFDRKLLRETSVPVQLLVDASDANAGTLIRNYCEQVFLDFNARRPGNLPVPFEIRSTVLFNPDMKSSFFFVPGIVAMILVMISALLTSVAITREKETGTLEQILVSPIQPRELIIGKVIPYILLALADAAIILLIGYGLFRVPFRGSILLLALLTFLYVLTALSLGLLISTRVKTQQVAMMAAQTATLLPTLMLSGLIFPIASMPKWLQFITYVVPARYYLLIIRGILLKGSTLVQLAVPSLALVLMTLFFLVVAAKRFRLTLEG